jgi:hypothetical protein
MLRDLGVGRAIGNESHHHQYGIRHAAPFQVLQHRREDIETAARIYYPGDDWSGFHSASGHRQDIAVVQNLYRHWWRRCRLTKGRSRVGGKQGKKDYNQPVFANHIWNSRPNGILRINYRKQCAACKSS